MAQSISIHPAVDSGVKPGRRTSPAALYSVAAPTKSCGLDQRPMRPQPRLRLHQMLEAGRRAVLPGRGRQPRQAERDGQRRQAKGRRANARSTPRMQRLRRAHVRPHREQEAPVLRLRLHPHRTIVRVRLVRRRNSPRSSRRSSSPAPTPPRWAPCGRD